MQDWETKVVMDFVFSLIAMVVVAVVCIGLALLLKKGMTRFL
jgi:hypothetical protein